MYFLIDIKVNSDCANFNFGNLLRQVSVKGSSVLRGGKVFARQAHKRGLRLPSSEMNQRVVDLTTQTLQTSKLPTRQELLPLIGQASKDFIRNPVRAIREGLERENLARETFETITGTQPSKKRILLKEAAVKLAQNDEVIVNTGGFVGSKIGGAIAGYPGELAGDVGTALVTRKIVTDIKLTRQVLETLEADEAFKQQPFLQKIKAFRQQTIQELKEDALQAEIYDNKVGDVGGWAVGNLTAKTAEQVPVLNQVPLIGAGTAMMESSVLVEAGRKIRAGEPVRRVLGEAAQKFKDRPAYLIRKGNQRERVLRKKIERNLRKNNPYGRL